VWHKCYMKSVGVKSNILKASDELKASLESTGRRHELPSAHVLFGEDGETAGAFLVLKGKVVMGIRNLPELDRVFSAGSLLGLPATFTGRPYSLTAVTVVQSDIVHLPREEFLQLMRERPDLCREATDMLGREVTFIQSALTKRCRQMAEVS
jgi:CRP-like cAMP-binding protein